MLEELKVIYVGSTTFRVDHVHVEALIETIPVAFYIPKVTESTSATPVISQYIGRSW